MCFIYHCLPFHDERLYFFSLCYSSLCAMNVEKDIEIEGTTESIESHKTEAIKAEIGTIARKLVEDER